MLPSAATLPLLVLVLAACGGAVVFEEREGDEGAGGGSSSPAGSGGGGSVASTAAGPGPGSTSSADVAIASSVGAGGAAAGEIVATIVDVSLGADCMPEVGPDPVHGEISVLYESVGAAPTSASELRADLTFATSMEGWVFPLSIAPTATATLQPGESTTVDHVKIATPGDSAFVCSLCGLEGVVTVRGRDDAFREVLASAPVRLVCAL